MLDPNHTVPICWHLLVMWQIASSTLHRTACCLHVDPEEILEEWSLQVVIDLVVIDHPHQLVHRHYRLTHRLYEAILSLKYDRTT